MKYYLLTIIAFLLASCTKDATCEDTAFTYRQEECIMVLTEKPFSGISFELEGRHLYNNQPYTCKTGNRWWRQYKDEMEVGDTIIKRKGELTLNIYKKTGQRLSHPWECEGKVYK